MPPTIPYSSTEHTSSATSPSAGYRSLLTSAALVPLSATGWIKVTGSDRVRWLNGMVTNSVTDLSAGAGAYNFLLNAQGRIQGDAYVFAEADYLLLETALAQLPALTALLDRFIIMDDVELADLSPASTGLLVAGPEAPALLTRVGLDAPAGPAPSLAHLSWQGSELTVIHAYSPLVPRFEIWSESDLSGLRSDLLAAGAAEATPADLELLRIAEGTPLFGTDIRDRDLPQETGANRALHFAKGCYLGQEIVERIRSRGNVHRTFGGFLLEGSLPAPGTPLTLEEKPVGELTSIAVLPSGNPVQLGLGYIRREAVALGKPIAYNGGTARPISLPFTEATIL